MSRRSQYEDPAKAAKCEALDKLQKDIVERVKDVLKGRTSGPDERKQKTSQRHHQLG